MRHWQCRRTQPGHADHLVPDALFDAAAAPHSLLRLRDPLCHDRPTAQRLASQDDGARLGVGGEPGSVARRHALRVARPPLELVLLPILEERLPGARARELFGPRRDVPLALLLLEGARAGRAVRVPHVARRHRLQARAGHALNPRRERMHVHHCQALAGLRPGRVVETVHALEQPRASPKVEAAAVGVLEVDDTRRPGILAGDARGEGVELGRAAEAAQRVLVLALVLAGPVQPVVRRRKGCTRAERSGNGGVALRRGLFHGRPPLGLRVHDDFRKSFFVPKNRFWRELILSFVCLGMNSMFHTCFHARGANLL